MSDDAPPLGNMMSVDGQEYGLNEEQRTRQRLCRESSMQHL